MFQSKPEEEEELSIVSIHAKGAQRGSCPLSWGRKHFVQKLEVVLGSVSSILS